MGNRGRVQRFCQIPHSRIAIHLARRRLAQPRDLKRVVYFPGLRETWLIANRLFSEVISRMDERGHVIV